ncbi:MAG: multidrug resistance protein [bacterium]
MRFFIAVLMCICVGVGGQLLLKTGVSQAEIGNYFQMLTHPAVIIGGFLYIGSSFLWLLLLQRAHLSYLYPLISVSYVLVVIASCLLFQEIVSPIRWIGVGVICVGVTLVSQS